MDSYYAYLETEKVNQETVHIDQCSTREILQLINREDALVAEAVNRALPQIAAAVDTAYLALKRGGHLLYIGAGTSGRLGSLRCLGVRAHIRCGTGPCTGMYRRRRQGAADCD